jgi:hypothetical protein
VPRKRSAANEGKAGWTSRLSMNPGGTAERERLRIGAVVRGRAERSAES